MCQKLQRGANLIVHFTPLMAPSLPTYMHALSLTVNRLLCNSKWNQAKGCLLFWGGFSALRCVNVEKRGRELWDFMRMFLTPCTWLHRVFQKYVLANWSWSVLCRLVNYLSVWVRWASTQTHLQNTVRKIAIQKIQIYGRALRKSTIKSKKWSEIISEINNTAVFSSS